MTIESPFRLAEDEVILRSYTIAVVDYRTVLFRRKKIPKRKGRKYNTTGVVYLTNRRLIYNVDNRHLPRFRNQCRDLYSQQIRVEDIQGIDFMSSASRRSLAAPILLIVLGSLAFLLSPIISTVITIAGVLWLVRREHPEVMMMFGVRSPFSDHSIFVSKMSRGHSETLQYWCAPTPEFERMSRELGAIVLDLQKYGDDCISKWQSIEMQERSRCYLGSQATKSLQGCNARCRRDRA